MTELTSKVQLEKGSALGGGWGSQLYAQYVFLSFPGIMGTLRREKRTVGALLR